MDVISRLARKLGWGKSEEIRSLKTTLSFHNGCATEIDLWRSKCAHRLGKIRGLQTEIGQLQSRARELDGQLAGERAAVAEISLENKFLREKLNELLSWEREVQKGMMSRIGLLPNAVSSTESPSPKATNRRGVPWPVKASTLEADARAKHWENKIKEVEEADAKVAEGPKDSVAQSDEIATDIAELESD